jgi:fermentation-respiration switch protein FrsA (DUF1100 family)
MPRRLLIILAVLSLGYLGVGLFVVLWMTGPKRKAPWATPAAVGLDYEEVEVPSTDGIKLRSWWVPAENSDKAVVLVPGWGGYKFEEHLLQTLPVYRDAGYSLLMLDLRAQGESEGTRRTLGYREVRDVRGALAWLRRRGYAPGRIVLHGWSMGGATALRAAPGTGVAAVVEEAGYGDLPLLLRAKLPEFVRFGRLLEPALLLVGKLFPDFDYQGVRPCEEAAMLSGEGVPLFIIHSVDDDVVPYEQAELLAAAYPDSSLWTLKAYGHVEAYKHPEYPQQLRAFLNTTR